ncbi:hypothetical protein DM02DRAFT_658710 [Periconia macrospinosa]|uniref:Uncharacterized protein n=1 Tax=Periconia macrospinosa TaxID=97972 RepID=A0A2V1DFU2_9PLEO|nr:hypothetical protein DM02DRAFT_658710 [Periconia macrospinosa]
MIISHLQPANEPFKVGEDGCVIPPFEYQPRGKDYPSSLTPKRHTCGPRFCIHAGCGTASFHPSCYSIAPGLVSAAFSTATSHTYNLSFDEENLRRRRIKEIGTRALRQGIFKSLPLEIVYMIIGYVVLEQATAGFREIFLSLKGCKETVHEVNINENVYVGYRDIEDVSYVQWVGNTNLGGNGQLIHNAHDTHHTGTIHIAFDYLGIRRICFGNPPSNISTWARPPPYWIEIKPPEMPLVCTHDGLKVRSIRTAEKTAKLVAWPSPGLNEHVIYPNYLRFKTEGLKANRECPLMRLFECHLPTIKGYSAYLPVGHNWLGEVIADHHDDCAYLRKYSTVYSLRDPPTEYRTFVCDAWMHMPMNKGEYVEDIWLVKYAYSQLNNGLMFVTNRGRASMFGLLEDPRGANYPKFLHIFSKSCPTSRLYFNDINRAIIRKPIYLIGMDSDLLSAGVENWVTNIKPEWKPYPPSVTPSKPNLLPRKGYFSKCRLDVALVWECIDTTGLWKWNLW